MKLYYYESDQYKGVFMIHIIYEQVKQRLQRNKLVALRVIL
jgi:hypothetical protein